MHAKTPPTPGAAGAKWIQSAEALDELQTELAVSADEIDRTAAFPFDNLNRLGALGLLGSAVPAAKGGLGLSLLECAELVGAVGGGEASTGLVFAMNTVMLHLLEFRQRDWYDEISAVSLKGTGVLNALAAEPDTGSPSRGGLPNTVATQLSDGSWRINGRKSFGTGAPFIAWWLVLARTEEAAPRVGIWMVPGDAAGVTTIPTWNHHGMRATSSNEVRFENVAVGEDAHQGLFLPGSAESVAYQLEIEIWNGVLLSALYDGIARSGTRWLYQFLHDRKPSNLGASLATVPRLQSVVGEMETLLLVNKTLIHATAVRADGTQKQRSDQARLLKHIVTNNAIKSLELALSVTGNHGLDQANPLQRHYRDALCGRVNAPQSDLVLTSTGKAALGL